MDAVRRQLHEDTLFPLGRDWLDERLGDGIEFRPRDVLTWARDAWEDEQAELARLGGEAWLEALAGAGRRRPVTSRRRRPTRRRSRPRSTRRSTARSRSRSPSTGSSRAACPPTRATWRAWSSRCSGQCQGDGLPYTFRGVERTKKKAGKLPPYDLLVRERREPDGREVTTGVLFVTNVGLSATAALRRLLEDDKPPDHRLLVTDQERRPLKVGPQGVEYYRDLEKLGPAKFEHLKLDFEQYAGLDALRGRRRHGPVGRPGDRGPPGDDPPGLRGRRSSPRTTARTASAAPAAPAAADRGAAAGRAVEQPTVVALDEKDVRQYIMAQLAWQMGSTAQAIAKGYVEAMPAPKVTLRGRLAPGQGDRRADARRGAGPRHPARRRPVPAAEEVDAPCRRSRSASRRSAWRPPARGSSYFDAEHTRRNGLKTRSVTRLWKAGDDETACGSLFHNAVEAFNRRALDAPEVRAALEGDPDPRAIERRLREFLNRHCVNLDALATQARRRSSRRSSGPSASTWASWPTSSADALARGKPAGEVLDQLFGDRRRRVDVTFQVGPDGEPVRVTGILDYVFYDWRTAHHRIIDYKLTPAGEPSNDLFQVALYALMHHVQHRTEPDVGVLYLHPERRMVELTWDAGPRPAAQALRPAGVDGRVGPLRRGDGPG